MALSIYQLPGSNALQTAKAVYGKMRELEARFPVGLEYKIVYDTTPFIYESVWEVLKTLRDAILLVAIVVLVFLQNWRATLIPLTAVPVAIVGTFAVMAAMGFSLNNLSLFGLVLAIGIVVDDAIVVVENVERWLAAGLAPREAAIRAMRRGHRPGRGRGPGPLRGLRPLRFITGITGQFFRQFALTIAVSTVISAFNSLTLSPALAALLLKPHGAKRDPVDLLLDRSLGWIFRLFNWGFTLSTNAYTRTVGLLLRTSAIALVVYGGLLYLTYFGFTHVPGGFIPEQDKGYLIVNTQLPDGASVQRTQEVMRRIEQIARETPGVAHTVALSGQSLLLGANAPNFGSMYVMLDAFAARRGPAGQGNAILAALRKRFNDEVQEALVSVFGAPPVDGLGNAGGFKLVVEDRGNLGMNQLQGATDKAVAEGNATPGLEGVFTSLRANTPWLHLEIDRVKAKSMGVSLNEVFNALQIYMGSLYVNNFNDFGRSWQVNVQADTQFRRSAEDVRKLQVRNETGQMVPLDTLAEIRSISGPVMVIRYNMYPAATINGNMAPGTSSGQAIDLMEQVVGRQLLPSMAMEWTELTLMQNLAGNTAMYVFALAVVLVFLVLAAQYESWSLPLAVILVVPMCLLCSIAGVAVMHMDINIFTQIGFIVLVGLASKNAILIVEFARQQRESGMDCRQATLEACRLRLRPIMMTSFAFILGVVPLVIAEGAGAEMRRTLGTAVFSGMLGVTLFGIFLTPVFFYVIDRLGARKHARPTTPSCPTEASDSLEEDLLAACTE